MSISLIIWRYKGKQQNKDKKGCSVITLWSLLSNIFSKSASDLISILGSCSFLKYFLNNPVMKQPSVMHSVIGMLLMLVNKYLQLIYSTYSSFKVHNCQQNYK